MSQTSSPKWRMEGGRWVKVAATDNGPAEPVVSKMNGTSVKVPAESAPTKVNGFAPPHIANKVAAPRPEPEEVDLNNNNTEVTADTTDSNAATNNAPKHDITFEDLIRGSTPADIEKRCIDLVKDYLGGSWAAITSSDDVKVTRIAGGMTNQLYRVHLEDTVPRQPNDVYTEEPTDVAIKLYQAKHVKNFAEADGDERLNDNIILTIISQVGLGPKVYGIFNDGVIMAYHEHEQFRAKHQENAALLQELAATLARIHHLNVPVAKADGLMFKTFEDSISYAYNELGIQEIIDELKLEHLGKKNLKVALEEMMAYIRQMDCPTVFCHHDFRGGNILVTKPDNQIKITDLEYCGYGPRGYDIGTFFVEWGKTEIFDQLPDLLPPIDAIERFVRYYIAACDRLVPGYAQDKANSVEKLVKETKLFYAVQHMFFIAILVKQKESLIAKLPFDPKTKMTQIEGIYAKYNQIIQALIEDGTIEKLA